MKKSTLLPVIIYKLKLQKPLNMTSATKLCFGLSRKL